MNYKLLLNQKDILLILDALEVANKSIAWRKYKDKILELDKKISHQYGHQKHLIDKLNKL